MSELSCDTLFIGRNETHDLSLYHQCGVWWRGGGPITVMTVMYKLLLDCLPELDRPPYY